MVSVENQRPAMKIVSIRMSEDTWEQVQAEALRSGISASEFIRESALVRLGWRWAMRADDDAITKRLRDLGVMNDDF
jgi:hypothetical protein